MNKKNKLQKLDKGEKLLLTKEGCEEFSNLIDSAQFMFAKLVDVVGPEDAASIFLTIPLFLKNKINRSWAVREWLNHIEKDQIARLRK